MEMREIKGWHVFAGFAAAFAIIISVNLVLAVSAIRTFPGLEVKNSYVASQTFDERRAAQDALGWDVAARHQGGVLTLAIRDREGRVIEVDALEATVGRATHVYADVTPDFRMTESGYVAPVELGDGNWNIRMTARAPDGTPFARRVVLIKE
ncbi:FixH family protein [Roseovarius sp. SCSIO 43702]|uniref:FixH family protein n=1 Tax=Roseovarius sp. SCSIO 43702 TaxID=2823043 RepID=UPI001C738DE9|nr:FixH family protein [Roseovarius sp. SCSIO 43702]QYX56385.1 FixH family protein [Roseovarius sp. SCSIO 43702]